MSLISAGPANAAINIAKSCQPYGVEAEFFTTDLYGSPIDVGSFPVHCFQSRLGRLGYSRALRRGLRQELRVADVCHIHGLWTHTTLAAAWEAKRVGTPYVISTHGMLAPYFFRGWRGPRNRLWLAAVQRAVLERAAAVHFVCEQEHREAAASFCPQRVVVIANSVPSRTAAPHTAPVPRLLSLSGLNPRKNVECLIRSLPLLPESLRGSAKLKIAGSGRPEYVAQLKQLAAHCDPTGHSIDFVGAVDGDAKSALLDWAALFCLASYQEGQPSGVIEALAAGIPAVITRTANVPQVGECGAGAVVARNTPADFANAIAAQLLDADRYRAASRAALQLVDAVFLSSTVGPRWAELYTAPAAATPPSHVAPTTV